MPNERLIYADDFLDLFYAASAGQDKAFISTVEMVVEDTPTIDAVPVIQCKDCKHGMITKLSNEEPMIITCTHRNMFPLRIRPEFYCAYGAKMDAEVEG